MDPIVSTDWLADRLNDVVIVHLSTGARGGDPETGFFEGHLPGARLMVMDRDLAAAAGPVVGRHPLPDADDFAAALAAAGIGDGDTVVAYDDRNGAWASRLVWMLRIIGTDAALIDGNRQAWVGATETGALTPSAKQRTPVDWPPTSIADADDVQRHLDSGGVVVDSRDGGRYRGEDEPIDAIAGHIPGAISMPFSDNLDGGRFRSAAVQRDRFLTVATDPDTIVYCGSGVTACHNALAMEAAGLDRPRVYVGSWSGWSTDPARPVETGDRP